MPQEFLVCAGTGHFVIFTSHRSVCVRYEYASCARAKTSLQIVCVCVQLEYFHTISPIETALLVKPDLAGFFRKIGHAPTHS